MNFYEETKLFQFLTNILHIFGLWPQTKWKKSYIIYSYILHFVTSFLFCLFMLINLISNFNDFDKVTESLHPTLTVLAYVFKLVNYYLYGDGIVECSKKLLKIRANCRPNKNIFRVRLDALTKLTCFIYCAANFSFLVTCLKTFLVENTELPVPSRYPIDWQGNNTYFWIVYVHQAFGGFILVNCNFGMDCIAYYLMGMAAAQFEILQTHIQQLGMNIVDPKGHQNFKEMEKTNFSIKLCIYEHQQVLELVKDIERYLSIQFISQICLSGVMLSGGTYQITTISPSDKLFQFTFLVAFMMTIITQTFLYTFYGDGILTSSDSLSNAVYSSNWYVMPPVFRKDLIIILERLKQRSQIMAGKLFPLNLSLFATIINFAYRFYTILKGAE